jgi:hypothetical protein
MTNYDDKYNFQQLFSKIMPARPDFGHAVPRLCLHQLLQLLTFGYISSLAIGDNIKQQ